ncbi:MAG: hypothetical protein HN370_10340 [Phycisphaerales bacterium]|jgi:hypothetical protein|nr:hypothetical protein [Phycisphaerales bacterium]
MNRRTFLHTASISLLASQLSSAEPPVAPAAPAAVLTADDLADGPTCLGRPITDRKAWDALDKTKFAWDIRKAALTAATASDPDLSKKAYMAYFVPGNKINYQSRYNTAKMRLATFLYAECLDNKGRYRERIAHYVKLLCALKTWVPPTKGVGNKDYDGKRLYIGLVSSGTAALLALVHSTLGNTLPEDLRTLIEDRINERILVPYMQTLSGQCTTLWWRDSSSNWNAVCHANIAIAVLAVLKNPALRLKVIQDIHKSSQLYLKGFTPDGWTTEGPSYWNYGFRHYLLLAETLHIATNGTIDLYAGDTARHIASFGRGGLIDGYVYPSFADCTIQAGPPKTMLTFLDSVYAPTPPKALLSGSGRVLPMLYLFGSRARHPHRDWPAPNALPIRTFYPVPQVYIGRGAETLTFAAKGGHNQESHNHNDLGSFHLLKHGSFIALDPGGEMPNKDTFGKNRMKSDAHNSLGHSVPRIAGQLQAYGKQFTAKLVSKQFTPTLDTFTLDLAGAYNVKTLTALTRSFTYDRTKDSLVVEDQFKFSQPEMFESALIILGTWQIADHKTILIRHKNQSVRLTIETTAALTLTEQTLNAKYRNINPVRLAFTLKDKHAAGTVRFTFH